MTLPIWSRPRLWRSYLMRARGWRAFALLFALGAVSALALAPLFFFPAMIIGLTGLIWLLDGSACSERPMRSGFWRGFVFGWGYFIAGCFWIGLAFWSRGPAYTPFAPLGVIGLATLLAPFWGAAGAVLARWGGRGPERVLVFAIALAVFEWMRGHILSGLPWNLPAHVWPAGGAISQSAAWVGVYGLTLITVYAFAAPAALVGRGVIGARLTPSLIAMAGMLVILVLGAVRLMSAQVEHQPDITLRIVQTDFTQREKWGEGGLERVRDRYLRLSHAEGYEEVTHLLWPEGALPTLLLEDVASLNALSDSLADGPVLLAGTTRAIDLPDGETRYYNSLVTVSFPDGAARWGRIYDKVWLVPFGEYMPLASAAEAVGIDVLSRVASFTPGPGPRLLSVDGAPPFMPLICYEGVFPNYVARAPSRPGWLFNLSNDAWFGDTTGPRQHLNQSLYRAIETGVPLVRSAARGVSGVSDPYGRMIVRISPRREGAYDAPLPQPLAPTVYSRLGDFPFWTAIAGLIVWIVFRRWRELKRMRRKP